MEISNKTGREESIILLLVLPILSAVSLSLYFALYKNIPDISGFVLISFYFCKRAKSLTKEKSQAPFVKKLFYCREAVTTKIIYTLGGAHGRKS